MARARKSHDTDEEEVKSRGKLKPAYASNGRDRFVVYCDLTREGDPYPRVLILKFDAEYAARAFIDAVIHNDEYAECIPVGKREGIVTTTGVRITMFGKTLFELLEYRMSEAEKAWSDDQMKQMVLHFKYGTHEAAKKSDDNEEPQNGADETLGGSSPAKTKFRRKEPRAPKEPKVKVDKSGYVSANDIAGEHKVEGRVVRGILRDNGCTKPDIGWMWPKDSKELKEMRSLIEKGLKTVAKKKGKK